MSALSRSVCVYCGSSAGSDEEHMRVARRLGELLAESSRTVIYGGSRMGTMGALAEGALSRRGHVVGIMPGFLQRLEIAHRSLTELRVVDDMRSRKHAMLTSSQAVVALPGGVGTFEELLEALTLKKLGAHAHPIIIVNTRQYYAPLLSLFVTAEREGFFAREASLYSVVETPEEALDMLDRVMP